VNNIIHWLNSNQGFVMSLLTFVYVIATITIVAYNRVTIREVQKTREEESRPYIFAYLNKDPRDSYFHFRIKNYGKRGGEISDLNINPPLEFIGKRDVKEFLNNVILAPGQALNFILLEKDEVTSQRKYDVSIKYASSYNPKKIYNEVYTLLTHYSEQMGYVDTKKSSFSDEANELRNIASYLDSIRNKL
jgi:hypothetical protein